MYSPEHHLSRRASLSDSSSVRMSPSRTGPFTLRMMDRLLSSRNSTRTCKQCPFWVPSSCATPWPHSRMKHQGRPGVAICFWISQEVERPICCCGDGQHEHHQLQDATGLDANKHRPVVSVTWTPPQAAYHARLARLQTTSSAWYGTTVILPKACLQVFLRSGKQDLRVESLLKLDPVAFVFGVGRGLSVGHRSLLQWPQQFPKRQHQFLEQVKSQVWSLQYLEETCSRILCTYLCTLSLGSGSAQNFRHLWTENKHVWFSSHFVWSDSV